MDREAKRAAILAIASGVFGAGLFGYTTASASRKAASDAPATREAPCASPGAGAQADCSGKNGCSGKH